MRHMILARSWFGRPPAITSAPGPLLHGLMRFSAWLAAQLVEAPAAGHRQPVLTHELGDRQRELSVCGSDSAQLSVVFPAGHCLLTGCVRSGLCQFPIFCVKEAW